MVDIHHVASLKSLSPEVSALIRLALLTAARLRELCDLTTGQIDRSDPTVWIYRPKKHKSSHSPSAPSRFICFGPRAQRILAPFLPNDPEEIIFRSHEPVAGGQEQGYSPSAINRDVHRACLKDGVPPWRPALLRPAAINRIRNYVAEKYGADASGNVLRNAVASALGYEQSDEQAFVEIMSAIG
jgi:integrase